MEERIFVGACAATSARAALCTDGVLVICHGMGAGDVGLHSTSIGFWELVWRGPNGVGATWSDRAQQVRSMEVSDRAVAPPSTADWFDDACYCTEMNLSLLDVPRAVDMCCMFSDCSSPGSLDVSSWDTSSATDMRGMFYDCSALESLDLSGWDVSSAEAMFRRCTTLESLDVSCWDVSSAWDMAWVFDGCLAPTYLDLFSWDTSSVETMNSMFRDCLSLELAAVGNGPVFAPDLPVWTSVGAPGAPVPCETRAS